MASVTCVALANSVELSWEIPSTRADGSPLNVGDISHYTVVCGESVTTVPGGESVHQVTIEEVLPTYGSQACYMTTVDLQGLESEPSEEFILTRNAPPSPPRNILIITHE